MKDVPAMIKANMTTIELPSIRTNQEQREVTIYLMAAPTTPKAKI